MTERKLTSHLFKACARNLGRPLSFRELRAIRRETEQFVRQYGGFTDDTAMLEAVAATFPRN
jgi:hypothetical protein